MYVRNGISFTMILNYSKQQCAGKTVMKFTLSYAFINIPKLALFKSIKMKSG